MKPTTYRLYRDVNREVEYRGLTGVYIVYLGAGAVAILLIIAMLNAAKLSFYTCAGTALILAAVLFHTIYRLHKKYGRYGGARKRRAAAMPRSTIIRSREIYFGKNNQEEKA